MYTSLVDDEQRRSERLGDSALLSCLNPHDSDAYAYRNHLFLLLQMIKRVLLLGSCSWGLVVLLLLLGRPLIPASLTR